MTVWRRFLGFECEAVVGGFEARVADKGGSGPASSSSGEVPHLTRPLQTARLLPDSRPLPGSSFPPAFALSGVSFFPRQLTDIMICYGPPLPVSGPLCHNEPVGGARWLNILS